MLGRKTIFKNNVPINLYCLNNKSKNIDTTKYEEELDKFISTMSFNIHEKTIIIDSKIIEEASPSLPLTEISQTIEKSIPVEIEKISSSSTLLPSLTDQTIEKTIEIIEEKCADNDITENTTEISAEEIPIENNSDNNTPTTINPELPLTKDLTISFRNAVLKGDKLPVMTVKLPESRKTRSTKIEASQYDLPKYISIQKNKDKIIGFRIDKLKIIQKDGSFLIFKKVFTSPTQNMQEKNKSAIDYLDMIIGEYAILE